MKNKIGWCDMTWNPVIGCMNNCIYCYAKKMNKRFKFIQNWNKPEWKGNNFDKKFPKKPQRIFVGSMSEIRYWELNWILDVLQKVEKYPQHTFQFLTKFPKVYSNYTFPNNCWLGVTITKENDFYNNIIDFLRADFDYNNIRYVSFEPLLSKILSYKLLKYFDWVIIGFQTNPFKKIEKKAITDIIEFTRKNDIPLFLKDSIYKGYPDLPIIKEFPEGGGE